MRPSTRHRPQFEQMESREVLSAGMMGMPMIPAPMPVTTVMPMPHVVGLSGTTSGFFFASSSVADVGKTYALFGSGKLAGIGNVGLRAVLHSTGFIANGHATGQLLLFAPGGTLSVSLMGPSQNGFSPLPSMFDYTITGGTGKFAGATGSGTVRLALSHMTSFGKFSVGQFSMMFTPAPPPPVM